MKIDFVSDIACPWCAVGLYSLEKALSRLDAATPVELHFQPFELNPDMPAEGEDATGHLSRKYRLTAEQLAQNRQVIVERGAAVGFTFGKRERVWNTFAAHRLLHWAGLQGARQQRALKHALLRAYHGRGENPGARDVLLRLAGEAGLDIDLAREVLDSGRFADEVRAREDFYQQLGIHSVPSVIIDDRRLIQGGQPPDVFEQALRQIAAGG
jgi:predicted DsbA family dithiol-disulfide isomerase